MCKLLILTNTARLSHKQLSAILKASARIMGKTDGDGFGWSMLSGDSFVGERCLEPEYFENRFFNNGSIPSKFKPIFETWEANSFGRLPKTLSGGLLVHARISTNSISLDNTHPFVNDAYSLVHNGIIDNEGEQYEQKSTCDTEHALHHLTTKGAQGMVANVSGYYAIGALNRLTGELLVVKDHIANLNACYIPSLDSMAFGTSADQLREILKAADLAHTKVKAVKDNVALTFNRSGDLVSQIEITPLERRTAWDKDAYARSMGWDYDDYTYARHFPKEYERSGIKSEASTIPFNSKIEDDAPVASKWDDNAPIHFDFLDDNGNRIPNYRLDQLFIFTDSQNNVISAKEFMMLDDMSQYECEVVERATGEPVARRAG